MLKASKRGFKALKLISLHVSVLQVANGYQEDKFKVIYKRPTDLALINDVPICCNILICDMFDEGAAPTCLSAESRAVAFQKILS